MKKFREQLRSGEALAVRHNPSDPKRSRADILDLFFAEPVKPNDVCDGHTVMYIRGPLEQRDCGYGDSYESIRKRFGEALKDKNPCIVIRIDSPGGVVAGLNQCVYDMRRAKEASGKHVIVYVDELMASAAYAIGGGVADEVYVPPSGILGSIGVISTMFDTTGADEKAGFNFVTITSGDRKADGHPHQPIEDDAVAAERGRVNELAAQFFRIVKCSRGIDAAPLQAALFLGKKAVTAGLADEVAGWESLLVDIAEVYGSSPSGTPAQPGTNEADMLKLQALIDRTEKALAAEKDPKKRASLAAQLGAFQTSLDAMKKTYRKTEEEETEETPDEEDEEEKGAGNDTDREGDDMPGDEPKDEEDEEEAAAKKAEEEKKDKKAKKAETEPPEKNGEDDKEPAEEEDEEPEKEAFSTPGKRAALLSKARAYDALQGRVANIEKKSVKDERASLIKAARESNRITAKHAKMLSTKRLSFVKDFLEMHKTPMVFSGLEPESIPDDSGPRMGVGGDIPSDIMRQFIAASQASKGVVTIDQLVADYKKTLNGGATR